MYDLIVIGGGAAGFFAALSAKMNHPVAKVAILEKSAILLAKVRVSGGGRCNVTHACFEPRQLIKNYPRGAKELLGPFHSFQPQDTIEWFAQRGVFLKTEADGRMFPQTDCSETIIACLCTEAKNLGVEIFLRQRIVELAKQGAGFVIHLKDGGIFQTKNIVLATGSSSDGHAWARTFEHSIQMPVPSLFTFNVPTSPWQQLSGVSMGSVAVRIADSQFSQIGPLLITHFGFSGPAVLKLSAWGARLLHERGYQFKIEINWLPRLPLQEIFQQLVACKKKTPQQTLLTTNPFYLPKNFWKLFLEQIQDIKAKRFNDVSSQDMHCLAEKLHSSIYQVCGKTTHKEEFVTCGGVTLAEVDFKTMQSKLCPGLYFAGEILDIDGVTGGFNFQNAWTTGYIAGQNVTL